MLKYTDTYRVRVSDSDVNGFLKLPSFLQMMQELAKDHAEVLGVGSSTLLPQGLGWALAKLRLDIERLPTCGERVCIKTWASKRSKVTTEREFQLADEMGDPVATARTMWILFDLNKRRLERLDTLGDWLRTDELASDFNFGDMPLAPDKSALYTSNFGVRKDDVDMNQHVNNAIYLTWALEPIPDTFYKNHHPKALEVWFLSEVFRGQRLDSVCSIDNLRSKHSIICEGREKARVNIDWINA